MEDMGLTARLFETSSKLHLASLWLERIAEGKEPDTAGKEALTWVGQFLREVDWSNQTPASANIGGRLAVQATSIRPTFYSSLIKSAHRFREAGITTEKDILKFLKTLYDFLALSTPQKHHNKLTRRKFILGALFLHEIAESIFVQLNNNGLPRSSTSLKEHWEPFFDDLGQLNSAAF